MTVPSWRNNAVTFLRGLGADKIPHGRRTLFDHLIGTEAIVRRWGASKDVCKAALFHSVYGTEFFKNAPLTVRNRRKIRKHLGPQAEHLVFVFCTMQRASVYEAVSRGKTFHVLNLKGKRVNVSRAELCGLLMILWANAMEQNPQGGTTRAWRKTVEASARFLPKEALQELRAYTASTEALLGMDVRHVHELLDGWPNQYFSVSGPVSRLGGLADFSFEELAALPRRFTKAFTDDRRQLDIIQGQESVFYDQGHTVYWHSLRSPTIDLWLAAIDLDLGLVHGATRLSAFASRRGAGLKTHYDPNDNFVCQARGTKTWRVYDSRVLYPTVGHTLGMQPNRIVLAENGGYVQKQLSGFRTIVMQPGDVMFMPRGVWHDTVTSDDESLHFNVQCGLANWKDAVDFVLSTSAKMHTTSLCAPILSTPNFKYEVQKRLLAAAESIASSELEFDAEEFRKFVMRRKES